MNVNPKTAFIGIGSNVGDRLSYCRKAVRALYRNKDLWISRISSLYETAPLGFVDQDPFYNAAIAIQTYLSPLLLLTHCQNIEKNLRKKIVVPYGPRTIDLDLLLYENCVSDSRELTLPHPELTKRHFVLIPLAEIADDFVHPISLYTMATHLDRLGPVTQEKVKKCFDPGWEQGRNG